MERVEARTPGGWSPWWAMVAARARDWLDDGGHDLRRARVLLPQAAHVPLLRAAWAGAPSASAWLPRIGTVAMLADACAAEGLDAPEAAAPGGITFDRTVDALAAHARLLAQPWARAWQQRDPAGFAAAVSRLVQAAHELARAAHARSPDERLRWIDDARRLIGGGSGPGLRERMLGLTALDWLEQTTAPPTDALFAAITGATRDPGAAGARADAWILAGFAENDAWIAGLSRAAAQAGVPMLCLVPQIPDASHPVQLTRAIHADLEDEAGGTAAQVLNLLASAAPEHGPVAVIAQDRTLVRRVRALLEPAGVVVADETGWKLSTTRAAAAVMAWLRAASSRAASDDLLDALKSGWGGPWSDRRALQDGAPEAARLAASAPRPAVDELERCLRASRCRRAWDMNWPDALSAEPSAHGEPRRTQAPSTRTGRTPDPAAAHGLWCEIKAALAPLDWSGRLSLAEALARLGRVLQAVGAWSRLARDDAGRQVLAALRLDDEAGVGEASARDPHWQAAARAIMVDAAAFPGWVDRLLEQASYVPEPGIAPRVVFTPMARAALRPFAAVVWPAMDDVHFGEPEAALGWLGDATAAALGLPSRASLHAQTWDTLCRVLALQPVHVSWRTQDEGRPLGPSAWWERWLAHLGPDAATQVAPAPDRRIARRMRASATPPPAPRLRLPDEHRALWPERLNATAYEHLRACPYRFFMHAVLGLREQPELEEGVDARDYGTWLHEVLRRLHAEPSSATDDREALIERFHLLAEEVRHEWGWAGLEADPEFLPHVAALTRLVPAYVDWWLSHRATGARVAALEVELDGHAPALEALGVTLHGQLDRVDAVPAAAAQAEAGARPLVIDYKTSSVVSLQSRMKPRLEDTQLAFYAALTMLHAHRSRALVAGAPRAAYLSLEDRQVTALEHDDVADSAEQLIEGLTRDVQRLRAGHPMFALGEGQACEYCAARGLCRKDDWGDADPAQEGAPR